MQEEYHERSEVSTVRRTSLGRRTSPYVPVFRCKRPRHGDAAEMFRSDEYESWQVAQGLPKTAIEERPRITRVSWTAFSPFGRSACGRQGPARLLTCRL